MCMADTLVENSKVKLATVATIVIFVIGAVWKTFQWERTDALWKQALKHELSTLQFTIDEKAKDRWTRSEMRLWVEEFRRKNPDEMVPSVDTIRVDH